MIKLLKSMFMSKANKQEAMAAKFKTVRMQAFLAVYDNPIRANGCYGWKLRVKPYNV